MSNTPEYRTWSTILTRCYNPNANGYAHYGGRGIGVCDRWRHSFENFFADMGKKPSLRHSIDRINVNGNYGPDNCRWATHKQQARNTTRTVFLTHGGITLAQGDWADKLGIKLRAIEGRRKRGCPIESVLFPGDLRYNDENPS